MVSSGSELGGGELRGPVIAQYGLLSVALPDNWIVSAEGGEPETAEEGHLEGGAAALFAPARDEQKQRAGRCDKHGAIREPDSDRGRQPPDHRAPRALRRIVFGCPDGEGGKQQGPEGVAGVVLDLERIVREPRRDAAQEHQRRRPHRSHPSSTDPQRGGQGGDPEDHRDQACGEFVGAQREQRRAHNHQPAERRALPEPQQSAELGERSVAHVERDRLFVEPEGHPALPLVDVEAGDDQTDGQRGRDVLIAAAHIG